MTAVATAMTAYTPGVLSETEFNEILYSRVAKEGIGTGSDELYGDADNENMEAAA